MRPEHAQSPLNPVPAVVWALVLPMIACEAAFGLAGLGLTGGGGPGAGMAMRAVAVERTAWVPDLALKLVQMRVFLPLEALRILVYPFVHLSLTHAVFVIVFCLALGNLVASQFRPAAVIVLFMGSAVGAALVYTLVQALLPGVTLYPLVGGYPGVYGLVGAFTFLLWIRLGQQNANRMRAFSLIGALLGFQLLFAILFQSADTAWIAEIAGFAIGFLLSFVLVPGGLARVVAHLRQR